MKHHFETYQPEDFLLDEAFFRIVKKAGRQEPEAWQELLLAYPDKRDMMEEAARIIQATQIEMEEVPDSLIEANWERLQESIDRRHKLSKIKTWISVAACIAGLIVASFLWQQQRYDRQRLDMLLSLNQMDLSSEQIEINIGEKEQIAVEENAFILQKEDGSVVVNDQENNSELLTPESIIQVKVPYGKRSQIVFSDGTRAWVNSGTKLLYPATFRDKRREVFVDGEIFLEVHQDASRPFFVHTNRLEVKVTGTSFNVTAYSDDTFSSVVLTEGSVELTSDQGDKAKLQPRHCLHYENGIITVSDVDVSLYTGWKDGYLKLHKEPLKEIFKKLSRYYDVGIVYDERLGHIQYKGKLDLNESIEEILASIALTEHFTYRKTNREINIMYNK